MGGDHYRVPELHAGWSRDPKLDDERRRASLLVAELADRRPWGFKDPRAMLVLELWCSVVPDLRVVLCVRNPLEVARSIAARGELGEFDALRWWSRCYTAGLAACPAASLVVAHDRS